MAEILEKIEQRDKFLRETEKEDEKQKIRESRQMNKDIITSAMKGITKNLQEVFVMAYHLKKFDSQYQTKHCNTLFLSKEYGGNIPEVIKKIIASNKYIGEDKFEVIEGAKFKLLHGTDFFCKFQYEQSDLPTISPFVSPITKNWD